LAADDEIPRGYTQNLVTAGTVQLIYYQVLGISWVITHVDITVYNTTNLAYYQAEPTVVCNGVTLISGYLTVPAAQSGGDNTGTSGNWTWDGNITGTYQQGLTVSLGKALLTNQAAIINATAYPI
jgi:hypothetical protein